MAQLADGYSKTAQKAYYSLMGVEDLVELLLERDARIISLEFAVEDSGHEVAMLNEEVEEAQSENRRLGNKISLLARAIEVQKEIQHGST
jgi:hypothetical protein